MDYVILNLSACRIQAFRVRQASLRVQRKTENSEEFIMESCANEVEDSGDLRKSENVKNLQMLPNEAADCTWSHPKGAQMNCNQRDNRNGAN